MEMGDQLHATAALPPAKNPRTHWTRGFVGPRAGPDDLSKRYVADEIVRDARVRGHNSSVENAILCAATCYIMF